MIFTNEYVYDQYLEAAAVTEFIALHARVKPFLYAGIVGNFFCSCMSMCMFSFAVFYIRRMYVNIDGQWMRLAHQALSDRVQLTCIVRDDQLANGSTLDTVARLIIRLDPYIHRFRCVYSLAMGFVWTAFSIVLFLHSGYIQCSDLLATLVPRAVNDRAWSANDPAEGSAAMHMGIGRVVDVCYQEKVELTMAIFIAVTWYIMVISLSYILPPPWKPATTPLSARSRLGSKEHSSSGWGASYAA
ncbi:hypothetical protein H4R34_000205 [Dimargaris verticillata]|uniref:Uncharacterized protein n=1 Tax=Dimargaris verticillata TaxID=2761393 RepID=A0A9W8BAU0_9FUNG|nr:hypothetical protein H4R34_000205 [Dimargaris verticillata]